MNIGLTCKVLGDRHLAIAATLFDEPDAAAEEEKIADDPCRSILEAGALRRCRWSEPSG